MISISLIAHNETSVLHEQTAGNVVSRAGDIGDILCIRLVFLSWLIIVLHIFEAALYLLF